MSVEDLAVYKCCIPIDRYIDVQRMVEHKHNPTATTTTTTTTAKTKSDVYDEPQNP